MSFAQPGWLWLVPALLALMVAVWIRFDRRQRQALERFVAPHLAQTLTRSVSPRRRWLQRILYAGAIALVCVALAEPRAGYRLETVQQRGTDLLFAVDTSRSMLTPDVRPDRLTRAKLAIEDLVGQLNGDAVGLIAFAGNAFVQVPMTLDYGAFQESVAALDTHVIPRGGTDIGSAIREAREAFRAHRDTDKVLVLLTDGEDLAGEAQSAAQAAARDGIRIYTVGVGTSSGDLIPLPADQGGGFLKDPEGHLVKSRLDEPALKAMAEATGGMYVPLGAGDEGLDALYRDVLAPRARHDLETRTERVYLERFQWPLGASLLLLLASLLVPVRRRDPRAVAQVEAAGRAPPLARQPAAVKARSTLLLALGLVLAAAHGVHAAGVDPTSRYNDGTTAYKSGDYARAVEDFRASLAAKLSADSKRIALQEDAYYDLGNGLYRLGEKSQTDDPKKTVEAWTQALAAYDAALELRPQDGDSRFNRDFVKRRLDALKQAQSSASSSGGSQGQRSSGQNSASNGGSSQQGAGSQEGSSSGAQPAASDAQRAQGNRQSTPSTGQQSASSAPSAAQNGGRPPAQGHLSADAKQSNGGQRSEGATPSRIARRPGEMSVEEAEELLDSVKDEEHHLPGSPSARNGETVSSPEEPARDW